MAVYLEGKSGVVIVSSLLDLTAAEQVQRMALELEGDVTIDCHAVRVVDDAALASLVRTLRRAGRQVEVHGLCWPHAQLLKYLDDRPR